VTVKAAILAFYESLENFFQTLNLGAISDGIWG